MAAHGPNKQIIPAFGKQITYSKYLLSGAQSLPSATEQTNFWTLTPVSFLAPLDCWTGLVDAGRSKVRLPSKLQIAYQGERHMSYSPGFLFVLFFLYSFIFLSYIKCFRRGKKYLIKSNLVYCLFASPKQCVRLLPFFLSVPPSQTVSWIKHLYRLAQNQMNLVWKIILIIPIELRQ